MRPRPRSTSASGLAYIEPELREDRGELEAAAKPGGLPELVELADIRGDLHSHTIASDGRYTIEEMAIAARERGYEYLAITDHSASHGFGDAVSPDQLERQIELIAEANGAIAGRSSCSPAREVNILPDGSLDYEDELLARLDWVIASVHTSFGVGEQAMTERMIAAVEHPLVRAIGHPTGRKIEGRDPYAVDLEAVFAAAARSGTMLEINGNPDRRDLSDVHARAAAQAGVTILIDSDAHRTDTLANMRWGVATAPPRLADGGAGRQHAALGGASTRLRDGVGLRRSRSAAAAARRTTRASITAALNGSSSSRARAA